MRNKWDKENLLYHAGFQLGFENQNLKSSGLENDRLSEYLCPLIRSHSPKSSRIVSIKNCNKSLNFVSSQKSCPMYWLSPTRCCLTPKQLPTVTLCILCLLVLVHREVSWEHPFAPIPGYVSAQRGQ